MKENACYFVKNEKAHQKSYIIFSNPIKSDISPIAAAFLLCREWAYILTVVDTIECPAKSVTVTMSIPFDINNVINVRLSP